MTLANYLNTIAVPMHRVRVRTALEKKTQVNGKGLTRRHIVVEEALRKGYKVEDKRGELVLMSPEGSWFDADQLTKAAIDYAVYLTR